MRTGEEVTGESEGGLNTPCSDGRVGGGSPPCVGPTYGEGGVNPGASVFPCHGNTPPPQARIAIEQMTTERVKLYQRPPPPGRNIPVELTPFPVYDGVPEED